MVEKKKENFLIKESIFWKYFLLNLMTAPQHLAAVNKN